MEGWRGPALLQGAVPGFEAQIFRQVTDPGGAVVSGTKVRLTDVASGIETSTTSNNSGSYTLKWVLVAGYVQPGHRTARFCEDGNENIAPDRSSRQAVNVNIELRSTH